MLLLCLVVGLSSAWGEDAVYKTAFFGSSYNSKGVSSYTGTFSATNDGFTVDIANFNNNNNGWSYVKTGNKTNATVGTITTNAAIDKAITKVVVTIDAVTATSVNSIKLYSGTSSSSITTEEGSFTAETGAQTVTISSPTADKYYKIAFDCKKGSSNGLVTVSKVEYYVADDSGSGGETTTVATPTIAYTNKVNDGTFYPNSVVTLSCATEGAAIKYSLETQTSESEGSGAFYNSYTYDAPFTVADYKNIITVYAEKDGVKSEKVTLTLTKATVYTTIGSVDAAATATKTSVLISATDWVCTGVKGSNVYFTDGTNGILLYQSGHGFEKGDKVNGTFTAQLTLYNDCAELMGLTSTTDGVTVTKNGVENPATVTIDQLVKNMQGNVVKIENLTYNSEGKLVDSNNKTILPYNAFMTLPTLEVNHVYNVTGVAVWYKGGSTWEIAPRAEAEVVDVTTSDKENPTLEVTIPASLEYGQNYNYTLTYDGDGTLSASSSDEKVATVSLNGKTLTVTPVATGTTAITVSASETVKYYPATKSYNLTIIKPASLPFSFDGGKADTETTDGISQTGLGSDYSATPKLKFDGAGDNVIIYFNGAATTLSYTVKGNGNSGDPWSGTFSVLESADGNTYTTIKSYTTLDDETEETYDLLSSSRYVKFVYENKTLGNVALGNISITADEIAPHVASFSVNGTTDESKDYTCGEGRYITFPANPSVDGYVFRGWVKDEIEDVVETEPTYVNTSKEKMGSADVTYYAVFATQTGDNEDSWEKVNSLDEVTDGTYVIESAGFVLPDKNSDSVSPDAETAPTIENGVITGEVKNTYKWVLTYTGDDEFTLNSVANTKNYLYTTDNNTGVRTFSKYKYTWNVGKNDDAFFMQCTKYNRYLGVYSSKDWRCYGNLDNGGFMDGAKIHLYKLHTATYSDFWTTEPAPYTAKTLTFVAYEEGSSDRYYYATFSSDKVTFFPSENGLAVYTVNVEGESTLKLSALEEGTLNVDDQDVSGTYVTANTGVLISESYFPEGNLTITYYTVNNKTISAIEGTNLLKPASEEMTGDYKFYKLAYDDYTNKTGLGFYYGAENGGVFTCKAGTAYLAVPTNKAVKSFTLSGAATDIKNVETATKSVIYNLNGQRLNKMQKGINIVDGKKYLVK